MLAGLVAMSMSNTRRAADEADARRRQQASTAVLAMCGTPGPDGLRCEGRYAHRREQHYAYDGEKVVRWR